LFIRKKDALEGSIFSKIIFKITSKKYLKGVRAYV